MSQMLVPILSQNVYYRSALISKVMFITCYHICITQKQVEKLGVLLYSCTFDFRFFLFLTHAFEFFEKSLASFLWSVNRT